MITSLQSEPDTRYAAGLILFGLIWVNPLITAGVLVATLAFFPRAHPRVRAIAAVLLVFAVIWMLIFAVGAGG